MTGGYRQWSCEPVGGQGFLSGRGQLRHSTATEIRRAFGAEAAQLVLATANLSTTEIYAEKTG